MPTMTVTDEEQAIVVTLRRARLSDEKNFAVAGTNDQGTRIKIHWVRRSIGDWFCRVILKA